MQIQISWLLQKPTDLDLHCLQRQGISGFSRSRVKPSFSKTGSLGSAQVAAWNSAYDSSALRCREPFIVTISSSPYDFSNVERDIKYQPIKWDISEQCRHRSDASECGVWSMSSLLAYSFCKSGKKQNKNKNKKNNKKKKKKQKKKTNPNQRPLTLGVDLSKWRGTRVHWKEEENSNLKDLLVFLSLFVLPIKRDYRKILLSGMSGKFNNASQPLLQ